MLCGRKPFHVLASSINKYKQVHARNANQQRYLDLLHDDQTCIVVASGAAGTGKTMLAAHMGIKKLMKDDIKKIVVTRPAVSVDEQHGFLPGTLEKKMEPWIKPIWDVMSMYIPKSKIDMLVKEQVIEICPLAYMRGRTFENAWIICDEAQNTTPNQMLMVMSRIGNNSKVIITGDPLQYDRGFDSNGLSDLIFRMNKKDGLYEEMDQMIKLVEFDANDVQRHPVIPYILDLYNS